jgi:hypothetical protein
VSDQELEHEDAVIGRALHALDAIDAVDLDVSADVEVLEYHEVVSHLPFEERTPPAALEARVLDAARAARAPEVPSLAARRRRARRIVAVGAAAAVAAIVTLAVFVGGGSDVTGPRIDRYISHADPAVVSRLRAMPGAREFDLTNTSGGGSVGSVVVTPNGDGAFSDPSLSDRPGVQYWFWVSDGNQNIRVGEIDPRGNGFLFTVHGVSSMTGALVSAEPAGKTPSKPTQIVARGTLR